MKSKIISLFHLTELLNLSKKEYPLSGNMNPKSCNEQHHYDFHCDSEKPFISTQF